MPKTQRKNRRKTKRKNRSIQNKREAKKYIDLLKEILQIKNRLMIFLIYVNPK